MRLALLQPLSHPGDPAAQFETLAAAARDLRGRADMLVVPELFMSGYRLSKNMLHMRAEPADGPFARRVEALAQETGVAILYGFPERHGHRVYNAVQAFSATGLRLALYRKLHLPSDDERAAFATGAEIFVFSFGGFNIAPLICYDVEFPESVRACVRAGADLIVAPTALRQHWAQIAEMMMPVRALESGVFLAYANWAGAEADWRYAGLSVICGPDGGVLARAGTGPEIIIANLDKAEIAKARAQLPYLRDARFRLDGPI